MRRTALKLSLLSALSLAMSAIVPASLYAQTNPTNDTAGITDKEILIGSCCALEGPIKFLGTQQIAGARAYLNYINDQGGVHGRKIRLLSQNDNYDPEQAIECFNKLIKENIFAAAFFVGTPTAAKYVPMAESHKIPLVGLFTGAQLLHEPFKPHVISVRASYFDETREQVDHLVNDLHAKKIAVIMQNDAFGAAVLAGVRKAMERHKMDTCALGSFARSTVDVDPAIETVKKSNPDAVIMVGGYTPLGEIVKRAHAQRWNPIFTTVSFVGTEAFIKAGGQDAEGTVITQVVPPYTRDDLPTVKLYKKLLKKYEPNEKPTFASFEGFIDAMVLVEGLKRAGKDLTRSKFLAAVESIHNLDLGLGPNLVLDYGPQDHKGFNSVSFTTVKDGLPVSFTDWNKLHH